MENFQQLYQWRKTVKVGDKIYFGRYYSGCCSLVLEVMRVTKTRVVCGSDGVERESFMISTGRRVGGGSNVVRPFDEAIKKLIATGDYPPIYDFTKTGDQGWPSNAGQNGGGWYGAPAIEELSEDAKVMLRSSGCSEVTDDYVVLGDTDIRILLRAEAAADLNQQARDRAIVL